MRGREYENNIKLEYLRKLGESYEDWISTYDRGNLLVINADELDFVSHQEDLGKIIGMVDRELYGIFGTNQA